MKREAFSASWIRDAALEALRNALAHRRPDVGIDDKGYVGTFRENLLPLVSPEDFEADLRAGDGNELRTKFRAAHSSSALAVNCFAPFRTRIGDLAISGGNVFESLQFERKCPTGLSRARPPNLDVALEGPEEIVCIESKLTEHLGAHRAEFSQRYAEADPGWPTAAGYREEMLRLMDEPDDYSWLDAAQLIKHAFGIAHTFRDRPATLHYLYWEPANPECSPVFAEHRREIEAFAERVSGCAPRFEATSYPELWKSWRRTAPPWLSEHLDDLAARYLVTLDL